MNRQIEDQNTAPPGFEAGRALWNSEKMGTLLAELGRSGDACPTGLPRLDELLGGGLRAGVTVLAGSPGAGKSSLALMVADRTARFGTRRALYASLEMSAAQLVGKSIVRTSAETDERPVGFVEIPRLMRCIADEDNARAQALRRAIDRYTSETAPGVATVDDVATVAQLEEIYASLPAGELRPLLVCDYAQLLGSDRADGGTTDVQLLTGVMRSLCGLAKRHAVPVLLLSSVNRAKRGQAVLDSLAGSSSLEYAACAVLFIDVEGGDEDERRRNAERDPRPVRLTIAKNRFGRLGSVALDFYAGQSRFAERP